MGKLEDDIKQLLEDRGISISKFAESINVPKNTLYSAFEKGLANSKLTTIIPLAEALDIDPIGIYYGRLTPRTDASRSVPVPLFGSIAAGTPIEPTMADDLFPIPATLHAKYPRAFMLHVEGNSMNRVLPNGSYALIDPRDDVESSGSLYAVTVGENAATVKRVRILDNGLELQPDSDDPTIHPIVFDRADESAPDVRVIGQVVWHCPPLD